MLEFRLQVLEEVDSSNSVVKRALEDGQPEGLAIQARRQTGGYGRQGRGWASPEGGMYLSLLLRPQVSLAQLPTLSLVTGLAVRDALRSLVVAEEARRIVVKWPNDVVYDEGEGACPGAAPWGGPVAAASTLTAQIAGGERLNKATLRKMCGISLESHGGGICIGIGVNVLPPAAPAAVSGNRPLYLAELGYGHTCQQQQAVDEVAQAVLGQFARLYTRWLQEGFAPFAAGFSQDNPLAGKRVAMVDVEGRPLAEGVAQGVDERGNLLLLTADGPRAMGFGEAHIV